MGKGVFPKNYWLLAAILIFCGVAVETAAQKAEKRAVLPDTEDASQFVMLADAVPDAILEIRYLGTYNFVGTRIDGYLEPTALLTREAADSLQAVSKDVMALGYRLKIYDAYRPQKAVDHFVRRAMMRHGFKPISSEWWHFTLKNEPFPNTYFTFPVKQLNR